MLDFETLLHELADGNESLPDRRAEPAVAFRRLYDGWVKRGGFERGKPRHAARQIKAWLGDRQVRSLETKLAGKTWLQRQDAASLIHLFLTRWTYDQNNRCYVPYSPSGLDELTQHLLDELFHIGNSALLLPLRNRTSRNRTTSDGLLATSVERVGAEQIKLSSEMIMEVFIESDALVTISRARTIIGADPAKMMAGFQMLMNNLYAIDRQDNRQRALVWVVDMGVRYDNNAARLALHNVQFLGTQFRALALLDSPNRKARWDWLSEAVCVLVGSLAQAEIDQIYAKTKVKIPPEQPDLYWFQSDRLFLESVPGRWLDVSGIEAFGRSHGTIWRVPTVTAHLRLDNWDLDHDQNVDAYRNLRYYFHGTLDPPPEVEEDWSARCIPLPQPGHRWSNGFRIACTAAFERLGRPYDRRFGPVQPEDALAQLRSQHFAVLRLDEFLRLPELLIESL